MSASDNLRIEITLGSPMIAPVNDMYLDSLLMGLNNGDHHLATGETSIMASKLFYLNAGIGNQKRAFSKKVDRDKVAWMRFSKQANLKKGGRIAARAGSGRYKDVGGEENMPTQWISKAIGWCVGDKAEIKEILSGLKHLGAKTRLGFGRVIKVELFDDDKASKYALYRAQPLSFGEKEGYARAFTGLKAPYWQAKNRAEGFIYMGECPSEVLTTSV